MARHKPYPGVAKVHDRHGRTRWRLRKTIKGRKIDTYLPGAYNSAEFREAYEAAINPAPAQPRSAGAHGTFNHVISTYLGSKSFKELKDSTRHGKWSRLNKIREQLGHFRMPDLEPYHIEKMMDGKGGPTAANRLRKDLSQMFSFACKKMGFNQPDPAKAVDERKTRKDGFHTWTEAEVQQYRDFHPSGTKARLAMEIMLATGASRQDACAMGRQNIKGQTIYYRRGKTGQDTELPLHYMPELVAEIRQLPPGTDVFITSRKGTPFKVDSFSGWFADQCKAAGLPDKCRAHGLRKRGATRLAEAGANEIQIMAFLAHKTTREALRYVRAANRKTLAEAGMAKAYSENVSNLADWLDKNEA